MRLKYLEGLNSLRFFAALLVIISHANISLDKLNVYEHSSLAFLNRGGDAVDFFFTLSGFLITYLLIIELHETETISIRKFYLRRIFRIWPLYFLIVFLGFIVLGWVYPKIYKQPYFNFSIPEGLMMFFFFLPNYAAKNYIVGFLNPLWSIGVEEQFYLFWAPFVKFFRKWLLSMIVLFWTLSTAFYVLVHADFIDMAINWKDFFLTQKFYTMATGSVFAYILFYHYEWYNQSFFASKSVQLVVLLIIGGHYLIGFSFSEALFFKIILGFLYGILILNVSVLKSRLINLERPLLRYLGTISYGLYMYHMLNDYFLRLIVQKLTGMHIPPYILAPLYYILLVAATIVVAAVSYRYFERFFLRLKDQLHNSKTASATIR